MYELTATKKVMYKIWLTSKFKALHNIINWFWEHFIPSRLFSNNVKGWDFQHVITVFTFSNSREYCFNSNFLEVLFWSHLTGLLTFVTMKPTNLFFLILILRVHCGAPLQKFVHLILGILQLDDVILERSLFTIQLRFHNQNDYRDTTMTDLLRLFKIRGVLRDFGAHAPQPHIATGAFNTAGVKTRPLRESFCLVQNKGQSHSKGPTHLGLGYRPEYTPSKPHSQSTSSLISWTSFRICCTIICSAFESNGPAPEISFSKEAASLFFLSRFVLSLFKLINRWFCSFSCCFKEVISFNNESRETRIPSMVDLTAFTPLLVSPVFWDSSRTLSFCNQTTIKIINLKWKYDFRHSGCKISLSSLGAESVIFANRRAKCNFRHRAQGAIFVTL